MDHNFASSDISRGYCLHANRNFTKGDHIALYHAVPIKIEISYINNVFDNYIETALKNPNMYFKSHTGFQGLLEQAYNKFKASKTPLSFREWCHSRKEMVLKYLKENNEKIEEWKATYGVSPGGVIRAWNEQDKLKTIDDLKKYLDERVDENGALHSKSGRPIYDIVKDYISDNFKDSMLSKNMWNVCCDKIKKKGRSCRNTD